jgi:flagellum-specific peptidoglycan hydrolase FlgJ
MPAEDDCGSEDCLFQGYASRWYGFYHHGRLLVDNYKQWLQDHDDATQAWAECLCAKEHKIGKKNYASACKNKEYTKTILSIIDTYQLTQYNINQ